MAQINAGNVVGLIKSQTAPTKKFVLWGKILNPSFPDIVDIHYWDNGTSAWTPVTAPTTNYWLRPVISIITTPPVTPAEGDRYLVGPSGADGDFLGKEDQVAEYKNSAWVFQIPLDGYIVTVRNQTKKLYDFRGVHGSGGVWGINDFEMPINPEDYILKTVIDQPDGVPSLNGDRYVPHARLDHNGFVYEPGAPNNWPVGISTIRGALDHLILQAPPDPTLLAEPQKFTGDGVITDFTLDTTDTNPMVFLVDVGGNNQLPKTTANPTGTYTVSGKVVSFVTAPSAGTTIGIHFFIDVHAAAMEPMPDADIKDAYFREVPLPTLAEKNARTNTDTKRFSIKDIADIANFIPHKLNATADPTVNNDANDTANFGATGAKKNSKWLNTTVSPNEWWVCSDPTVGAAVWTKISLTADELVAVAFSGSYNDLLNTPALAAVATSGDYNDLINKPTKDLIVETIGVTAYTFVLADAHKYKSVTAGTAASLTVPQDSAVAFPIGTIIDVTQNGAGQVSFVADTNVTINTPETLSLRKQFSSATLIKEAANTWKLTGDLTMA